MARQRPQQTLPKPPTETPMATDQRKPIHGSLARVARITELVFFFKQKTAYEIEPSVKPLFRGDIKEQGRKLMATLAVVVNSLHNLEGILPAASALAKRHVAYGVKPNHYAPVGAALLWTLEQGLGVQWTPE